MEENINEEKVLEVLSTVTDPELGISIVDLGLIYHIGIEGKKIKVDFTLTSVMCPLGDEIEENIRKALEKLSAKKYISTQLVWDPAWSPDKMSEEIKLSMGFPVEF